MELYLDSADLKEIKEAFQLGFFAGLTTTPTFMHRHGIKDIDATIVELSKIVPILQIEALGETAEEIISEAERQNALGLDKNKTVYKIPISLEGVKACKKLKDNGFLINIHLIYTLQQAYMAMEAGADYVCPLIGRLQDQGTDALDVISQITQVVDHYGYDTKVMFSSVRNIEHVRNALHAGVHTLTAPWKIIKQLTDNHLTSIGTQEFLKHARLMTVKVKEAISSANPTIKKDASIGDCLLKMSAEGFGAVSIIDDGGKVIGIFTDGDLRRLIKDVGKSTDIVAKKISKLHLKIPATIDANSLLIDAEQIFREKQIDQLVVVEKGIVIGLLDIQDLMKSE